MPGFSFMATQPLFLSEDEPIAADDLGRFWLIIRQRPSRATEEVIRYGRSVSALSVSVVPFATPEQEEYIYDTLHFALTHDEIPTPVDLMTGLVNTVILPNKDQQIELIKLALAKGGEWAFKTKDILGVIRNIEEVTRTALTMAKKTLDKELKKDSPNERTIERGRQKIEYLTAIDELFKNELDTYKALDATKPKKEISPSSSRTPSPESPESCVFLNLPDILMAEEELDRDHLITVAKLYSEASAGRERILKDITNTVEADLRARKVIPEEPKTPSPEKKAGRFASFFGFGRKKDSPQSSSPEPRR